MSAGVDRLAGPEVARGRTALRIAAGQVRYANKGFWRQPVAAFFTLVFPLTFLVVLCALVGNEVIDARSGLRFAQFLTPAFGVFGVCMASYVSLAASVAYARESGVLKRLRGAPMPAWTFFAGRIGSAVWVSAVALTMLYGVGAAAYGVQIVWRTLPALVITLLIGVSCFAALGLAVVSIVRSAAAVQAVTNASLILLAFVSGMFAFADLPDWVERVGWVFPLRHFVSAVTDACNPYLSGSGFAADHLAVLVAWGAAGAAVALLRFSWEPRGPRRGIAGRKRVADGTDEFADGKSGERGGGAVSRTGTVHLADALEVGRPSARALAAAQTRYCVLQILRDPMSVFFGMVFPVLLLVFFGSVYGTSVSWSGLALPQYLAAAFAVYGLGVMAYVNLAGTVAEQRSRLTLKRLRGTPLPTWAYIAGRVAAAFLLGAATVVVTFAAGIVAFGVQLPPATWLPTAAAFCLAIVCFTSLGLLLSSVAGPPQVVIAVSLGTLLPLSFVSDIFINIEQMPPVMDAIGWAFPLRHAVRMAVAASSGGALDGSWWISAGAVLAWTVAASALTVWLFRWEPKR